MTRDRVPALFVGDHLALDFLNTRSAPAGVWTDWLGDGRDLVDWLEQAGAIEADVVGRFRSAGATDPVAERARALRAWLRGFVERHAGSELGPNVLAELAPLNALLAENDGYLQVEVLEHRLRQRSARRWSSPDQLLQPIAEAIGDLVCHADFRLIRVCEGPACVLMFLDRSKAHGRRWCSMAMCGNRAKAAAHRARAINR